MTESFKRFYESVISKKTKNNPSKATSYIEMKVKEKTAVLWNI